LSTFLNVVVTGLVDGSIYALVALGFTLCFKAGGALNFAQGTLMLFGGYVAVSVLASHNAVIGLLVGTVLAGLIAGGGYFAGFSQMRKSLDPVAITIITMGASFAFAAVIDLIWHSASLVYAFPGGATTIHVVGNVYVTALDIGIVAVTVVIFILLDLLLSRTRLGRQMRASADSPSLAARSGLNVALLSACAWGIAGALAGFSGGLDAAISGVSANLSNVGLLAFPAAIIGGFGNIRGALVGGLALGLADQTAVYYISPASADAIAYLIMLAVLFARPSGLFGDRHVIRA
jgi:branched-chain amino acid transport system permease protein